MLLPLDAHRMVVGVTEDDVMEAERMGLLDLEAVMLEEEEVLFSK